MPTLPARLPFTDTAFIVPPLVTAADFKVFMGLPSDATNYDAVLEAGIKALSEMVRTYTGRILTRAVYRERLMWSSILPTDLGRSGFYTREFPIHDMVPPDDFEVVAADRGLVSFKNGPSGTAPFDVEYDAGYDELPADLSSVIFLMLKDHLTSFGFMVAPTGADTSMTPRAVAIGALRVDYAISPNSPAAMAGAYSPLTPEGFKRYAGAIDSYRSPYVLAAT